MSTTVDLTAEQLEAISRRVAELQNDGWMGVENLCSWLELRPEYVYQLVAQKRIPYVKVGRLLRFRRSEIEMWVEGFRR